MRIFLAGEGKNELGGWAKPHPYCDPNEHGVLEALLRKVSAKGWEICGALLWKYRSGGGDAEKRNVLALQLAARDADADVAVFSRDTDGDQERERSIAEGLKEAAELFPDGPKVAGGTAVQRLESWMLALTGALHTEQMSNAKVDESLSKIVIALKDVAAMVDLVDSADIENLPKDAESLHRWFESVRQALGDPIVERLREVP